MKRLLLLGLTLLLFSCENYDGETKLVVKGTVIDNNNAPVANKEIKLFAVENYDLVGHAFTDNNGNYTMVFPKPIDGDGTMEVAVNDDSNELNKKQYINIKSLNFSDYLLTLPVAILYLKSDLALLNVIPNQSNPNLQLESVFYVGEIVNETEDLNLSANPGLPTFFNLSPTVKKNQTLIINYTVRDLTSGAVSNLQQLVMVGNLDQIDVTLNY